MGDYNLDLLKCSEHEYTQEFLDIMYSNNLIPTATKPTRPKTKTLIDNIVTNNYQDNQKQERGMIYADLSDRFPIFNISKNINVTDNSECFIWKRKRTELPSRPLLILFAVTTGLNYTIKQILKLLMICFTTSSQNVMIIVCQ